MLASNKLLSVKQLRNLTKSHRQNTLKSSIVKIHFYFATAAASFAIDFIFSTLVLGWYLHGANQNNYNLIFQLVVIAIWRNIRR